MPRHETEKGRRYTEEQQKAALEMMAVIGPTATERELGVTRASLYRWTEKHARFWSDLRAGDPAAHKRGIANRLEDLADRYRAAEHDLLEKVETKLIPKLDDPKEAAALLKAMGGSRQAAIAGARAVSGEPEHVEHTINFPALEQAMERLLNGGTEAPTIEGTAKELDS